MGHKTQEGLAQAGDKTKEVGQSAVTTTKNTLNSAVEAVTPDKDARKIDVKLTENKLMIPKKLQPGKTYAVWINSEKLAGFKDTKEQPAVPYLLVFKTRD